MEWEIIRKPVQHGNYLSECMIETPNCLKTGVYPFLFTNQPDILLIHKSAANPISELPHRMRQPLLP
jgi:hypothetical protein